MTTDKGTEVHDNMMATTERVNTTISLNSGVGDGMMMRWCRILDNDNEVMLRRQWP